VDARERLAALGEIAAEVAHELRNALQIVASNVFLARQDLLASEPHLAKIERSTRIAQGIVDDVMALARGEATLAEPVPFDAILGPARELLPTPKPSFEDEISPGLVVRAHPGLTARLLHVLYENSIRAVTPEPARIVTRAERIGDRVVIVVADEGPGIPPEIAGSLFAPLVTGRRDGTGLGLALARRIAAAHGGTIALVPSERGATFRIEWPAQ
jgi:signal transduction histidine kinase